MFFKGPVTVQINVALQKCVTPNVVIFIFSALEAEINLLMIWWWPSWKGKVLPQKIETNLKYSTNCPERRVTLRVYFFYFFVEFLAIY